MDLLVLLLLGTGFALLAWSAWRNRAASDPASSVEGFARVLNAIDPDAIRQREAATVGAPVAPAGATAAVDEDA